MSLEFAYLLKVNIAFTLFYAFYRLIFYKDTFFKLRRTILLAFFLLAFAYPLFNMQEWIREQEPIVEVVYVYSALLPEIDVAAEETMTTGWMDYAETGVMVIYLLTIAVLLGRFFIQLGSILWLAHRSRRVRYNSLLVRELNKPAGPFSFFRLIFLYPDGHTEKEIEEILTHEHTHVSQWHSIDVILSEMITIFCWYNPFVWLLKREVRHNLEYLADNHVLQAGYDSRSYQYHLLGLAHHSREDISLYNSFNVLHLKNRIIMMNRKRSHGISRTKYLIFIPLVFLLMLISNIEALARITSNMAKEAVTALNNKPLPLDRTPYERIEITETPIATDKTDEIAVPPPRNEEPAAETTVTPEEISEITFTVVEEMPSYPGGDVAMLDFVSSNIRYPVDARENGIQGRVIASMVITETGEVTETTILRGIDPSLDSEAVRVINSMPRWTPGRQRGRAVRVKYTLPIMFRLSDDKETDITYTTVDEMPIFPGGDEEMMRFINRSIKYPVEAQQAGIQGRVITSFVIDKSGNIKDIEVVRGIDPSLDREAIRVAMQFPQWKPGAMAGVPVDVKYTLPIVFLLQ